MITYELLDSYTEIAHFCTTRNGGVSMGNYASNNLSPFSGDDLLHFSTNRNKLVEILGSECHDIIIPFQNHGTEIREIDEAFLRLSLELKNDFLNGVDAIYTELSGICIGITTADCVPLLFYDSEKNVIAAAHAGWRGTCGRIGEKTVHTLIEKYDCRPEDIRVVIGPSISAAVYEVGKEVIENFEAAGFDVSEIVTKRNNATYLDLWKANQLSLTEIGIQNNHIETAGICTFTEHEKFFSARRLGIKSGRMLSGIMLK
ncbi:MAG TPA: peptidoglycan editing factor PgeF [Paludibacter sp.]